MQTKPNQRRSIINNQIRKSIPVISQEEIIQFADKINTPGFTQPSKDYLFNIIYHILNKQSKSMADLTVMVYYLLNFPNLNSILKVRKDNISPEEMLRKISIFLRLEYGPKNTILCQNGQKGDKYYLILKGKVSILVPFPYKIELTEEEYDHHLKTLKKFKEYDLIRKTLDSNHYTHMTFELIEELSGEALALAEERDGYKTEMLSMEEYMSRIIPLHNQNDYSYPREDLKSKTVYIFTLWQYRQVCEFSCGSAFGDIALKEANCRRTATIITLENTHLGTLTRDTYYLCIKDAQEKVRKLQIANVLNNSLFEGFNQLIFEKHYFNFFKAIEYKRGDELFDQGSLRKEIYFLIEGEIELSTNTSLEHCNIIIEALGGVSQLNPNLKQAERVNPDLVKYYQRIREFRLFIIKQQEVIGLDDCLINKLYFCKASCKSQKCSMFSIEIDLFNKINDTEKRIANNRKLLQNKRKTMMIERLLSIQDISLSSYCNTIQVENCLSTKKNDMKNKNGFLKLNSDINTNRSLSKKKIRVIQQERVVAKKNNNKSKDRLQLSVISNSNNYILDTSNAQLKHNQSINKTMLPSVNNNGNSNHSTSVKVSSSNRTINLLFHRDILNKYKHPNKNNSNNYTVNSNSNYYSNGEDNKINDDTTYKTLITIPQRYQTIDYVQGYNRLIQLTETILPQSKTQRRIVNDLMHKVVSDSSPLSHRSSNHHRNSQSLTNTALSQSYSNDNINVNNVDCLIVDKCIEKAEGKKQEKKHYIHSLKLLIKRKKKINKKKV